MLLNGENYIGGRWIKSESLTALAHVDPATDVSTGMVVSATRQEIDQAFSAAAKAFPVWSQTALDVRKSLLRGIREGIAGRSGELAAAITTDIGAPIGFSSQVQVPLALRDIDAIIDGLDVLSDRAAGSTLIVHDAVGVVGAISPWNFPLHQMVVKLATAIAAGCTVVAKPSEYAPHCAKLLADIIHNAGVPEGVFNLVFGDAATGALLASHPAADLVSFTGSSHVGSLIAQNAARSLKRTVLELGGKSANIILSDADLPVAVAGAVEQCFANSGQFCAALSRLLVPAHLVREVEELAVAASTSWLPGDPWKPSVTMGPVVSRAHQARIRSHIETALNDGAALLTGGSEQPEGLPAGAYVKPTVLGRVTPDMAISRNEVFGPVLSITPYRDEDEAVRLANDSDYGLSGGIWSSDPEHALKIARRLRTGQVVFNGASLDAAAPFGGIKRSGWGREAGRYGIEEYTTLKAVLGAIPKS